MEPEKPTRLVENWRFVMLRSWSTRFVALVTAIGAFALPYLDLIASAVAPVISMLPPELRAFVPLPVMLVTFGTYALLKLWKQKRD